MKAAPSNQFYPLPVRPESVAPRKQITAATVLMSARSPNSAGSSGPSNNEK